MEIKRVGSQPSAKGPSEWFTGAVRIDPLFQAPDPALVQGASVTFEPCARTAAYASTRSDSHRRRWLRLGTALGRTDRGNSAR
jgi:quercetin dioxygenase-like cupin family protein